jgi:gliding motility-associated-like protein
VYVPDTEMSAFNFSSGANGYEWTFGDGGTSTDFEPKYTYKVEGKYDVTLIAKFDHGNGVVCRDTLTRVIIAKQGGVAKIPNSFTPNPNGRSGTGTPSNGAFNDIFLPLVKGISNDSDAYNLQIYDRWGNLVFESASSVVGWDGYNKDGKLMPMGVYVYKLTVRFSDSQRTTTVGDITMLY